MKTIQIVVDEALLEAASPAAASARINRSERFRVALREHLRLKSIREAEERDRIGYERSPVEPGEFDVYDEVAAWPDDCALQR